MSSLVQKFWNRLVTTSPQKAFAGLSDDEWLAVLLNSINNRVQKGVELPGFPADSLQTSTVGTANDNTLREAYNFYLYIRSKSAEVGTPITPDSVVLDFGICWGRIVRCFIRDTDNLYGVDVDANYLEAAKQTGCPAKLDLIDPLGRLPHPDGMFNVIYAYSIFTHLPEHVQDHWLQEFQRVLAPGGLLFATVQPPRFLEQIRAVDPDDESVHPWLRALGGHLRDDPSIIDQFEAEGSVFIPGSETYGDRILTEDYIRKHWGQYLEVVDIVDDAVRFPQGLVTLRRTNNG